MSNLSPTADPSFDHAVGATEATVPESKMPILPLPGMEAEMMDLFNHLSGRLHQASGKVLQFMSTQEGEGTTTLSRAFASVLAVRLKKSVLFIDAPEAVIEPVDPALSSALYSPRMTDLMHHLRRHYDFIILDAPAATTSSDGFALARHVDGVVLVVQAEHTRWPVVESLKDRIQTSGGNILGVVLNKRRYYIPSFLYKRV